MGAKDSFVDTVAENLLDRLEVVINFFRSIEMYQYLYRSVYVLS